MANVVNTMAVMIGYIVLGYFALRFLHFLTTLVRLFPTAMPDEYASPDHREKNEPFYTRYVFNQLPWMPSRVWQHVWGPLYVRIPESWAHKPTPEEEKQALLRRVMNRCGVKEEV